MADEIKYELKLGDASPLDQTDVDRVVTYARANKLTQEQAAGILKEVEATGAALVTRRAPAPPPDKYELKLQDQSALASEDTEKVAAYAKANRMTQEQAAGILKEYEATAAAVLARQQTNYAATVKGWEEATKADKDLGGDKFAETLKNTKRTMDRFAPEGSAFRKLVNETGYGNHPEFMRFVSAIGKAMGEDKGLHEGAGGGGGGNKKTPSQRLYPHLP